jgi:hypothetical protein
VSALNTQIVGELAAGLEGTVRVATVVTGAAALLTVLVRSMTALDAEIMSELASGLEGAIGVALEVVSTRRRPQIGFNYLHRCCCRWYRRWCRGEQHDRPVRPALLRALSPG